MDPPPTPPTPPVSPTKASSLRENWYKNAGMKHAGARGRDGTGSTDPHQSYGLSGSMSGGGSRRPSGAGEDLAGGEYSGNGNDNGAENQGGDGVERPEDEGVDPADSVDSGQFEPQGTFSQEAAKASAAKEKAVKKSNAVEPWPIKYEEPTSAAVDWSIVFDGAGHDVSFEEARAMLSIIKRERSITLTVRFLSRQQVTVRCAPIDTIEDVKLKIWRNGEDATTEERHQPPTPRRTTSSHSSSPPTHRTRPPSLPPSHPVRHKEPKNSRQPESTVVQGHTVSLSSPQQYVLTHNGMELPDLYSLEQCGLHNNTTIELHTSDVWEGLCESKLDEGMSSPGYQSPAIRRNAKTDGTTSGYLIPGATKLPPLVNCMSVLRLRLKHLSDDQTGGAGEEDMDLDD